MNRCASSAQRIIRLSFARSALICYRETAQGVVVVEEFEKRVHVTPLGLKSLRHGHKDDFARISRGEIKRAFLGAKHLGDLRRQEVLQIIANGFADTTELFRGLVEKAVGKMIVQHPAARHIQCEFVQILQFLFQLHLIGQQRKGAGQGHRLLEFGKQFKGVGDVRLGLAFEKAFVPALTKTGGSIDNKLGVGGKRDATVAGEIKMVRWFPLDISFIGADLQMNQIASATIISRHCRKRFPIDAFLINAQSAPLWLVLEDLMSELVDARTGFARTGVAGDEPAPTELVALPNQPTELRHSLFRLARCRQMPDGND